MPHLGDEHDPFWPGARPEQRPPPPPPPSLSRHEPGDAAVANPELVATEGPAGQVAAACVFQSATAEFMQRAGQYRKALNLPPHHAAIELFALGASRSSSSLLSDLSSRWLTQARRFGRRRCSSSRPFDAPLRHERAARGGSRRSRASCVSSSASHSIRFQVLTTDAVARPQPIEFIVQLPARLSLQGFEESVGEAVRRRFERYDPQHLPPHRHGQLLVPRYDQPRAFPNRATWPPERATSSWRCVSPSPPAPPSLDISTLTLASSTAYPSSITALRCTRTRAFRSASASRPST